MKPSIGINHFLSVLLLASVAVEACGSGPESHPDRLPLDQWSRHPIDALPEKSVMVAVEDLDGDGFLDIAAGAWWWVNPLCFGEKWPRSELGDSLNNIIAIYDFDEDGDPDILGTRGVGSAPNAELVVVWNQGQGRFSESPSLVATTTGDYVQGVAIARFNPDGPLEVALSWHATGHGVQLLTLPDNPHHEPWTWRVLSQHSQKEDLSTGDIDRDGDLDILLGTAWLENPHPATGEWEVHNFGSVPESEAEPDRNELADFNGDGRLDAVIGLEEGTEVLVFFAPKDPREPWERLIVGDRVGGGYSMDSADMDMDGDMDIVLGEHRGESVNRVIIYENQKRGRSWIAHEIDSGPVGEIDHHDGTVVRDIDGDGDPDIVSIGWYNQKLWIFENRQPGPAN